MSIIPSFGILNIPNATLRADSINTSIISTSNLVNSGDINFTGNLYQNGNIYPGVSETWSLNVESNAVTYISGNVGIGTEHPQQPLEVAGIIRISDEALGLSADLSLDAVSGSGLTQQQQLFASDAQANDSFGQSAAISGDGNTAIVGAYGEDTGGAGAGAAYIFTRSGTTWTQQQQLFASDAELQDYFGYSVAISGDGNTAIIGAQREDTGGSSAGAAYIFTRSGTTWTQQQQLFASDAQAQDNFGESVAISGDGNTAIVGTTAEDTGGDSAGAAYIFTRSGATWTEQQKIQASDAEAGDYFGRSISISTDGNTAIVGSEYEDTGANLAGAAYIFTRSGTTWTQQQKIQASDLEATDLFGISVAISGDGNTAIVGAYLEDTGGTNAGAAYIFTRSGATWTQQQKIQASDAEAGDFFGNNVSLSSDGNTAIVGAFREATGGTGAGAAYIFTRSGTTWTQSQKLVASDAQAGDFFGKPVSISSDGNTAIVGALSEDTGGSAAGAAYIFANPPTPVLVSNVAIQADGTILSFTGQHMCFPHGPMSEGLIVSANKNMFMTLNGALATGKNAIKSSESLPVVSLSNCARDRCVFGVVDRFESGSVTRRTQTSGATIVTADKELGDNRVIVNSIGEGAMWVVNANGNLVSGDYITSSNISGYGQKQDDDIVHSYTVAKITMDCDFNPDILPVQVIQKDAGGNNVLDAYGRLQWEDTTLTQTAYNIRYLTADGVRTDKSNALYIAAYVGCTYHCG